MRRLLLGAVVMAAVSLVPDQASAYALIGSKWSSRSIPLQYYINPSNGPQGFQGAVRGAADGWTRRELSFQFNYRGTTNRTGVNNRDGQHIVSYDPAGSGLSNSTLAVTYHWSFRGQMSHFDMVFNGRQNWSTRPRFFEFDLQTVGLHEFGHALGLDHSQNRRAVMYFSASPGSQLHVPTADDLAGAAVLYPGAASLPAPSQPSLSSPSGVITDSTPLFNWSDTSNTVRYRLELGRLDSGGVLTPVLDLNNLTQSQYQITSALTQGQTYYWRVTSFNQDNASATSDYVGFAVQATRPGQVTLTSPVGIRIDTRSPTFRWNAVSGANSYEIYIRPSDSNTPVVNQSVGDQTNARVNGFATEKVYYWWVRAVNDGGAGDWSEGAAFLVNAGSP